MEKGGIDILQVGVAVMKVGSNQAQIKFKAKKNYL